LFAVHFYNNKTSASVSNTIITNLISEAVEIEKEFITEALPCSLLGINADLMKVYIEFLANRLAAQLNSTKIYEDAYQPFSWMEMRNYEEVVNFFEKRSNIYKKKVIRDYSEVDTIHERNDLCFDDDFDL
jgi:ribonucleotide reductase beta subunit family protein with ferritin-like domain